MMPAMSAMLMTAGTKISEMRSAMRAIGAFLPCASSTMEMMCESVVSSSARLQRTKSLPSRSIVPPMTSSPCFFFTGMLSPLSMLSSTLALPSTTSASIGT